MLYITEEEKDADRVHGEEDSDTSDDGTSAPAVGNTEGESIQLSKKEEREARGIMIGGMINLRLNLCIL